MPGVGTFYAGEDESAALAAGHRLRERQLIIILAGLALVLLATIFVYRRVAVPIRRLGTHVRKTSALSPPEPVPVSGPAEVTDLGEDVNGLIAAVGRELEQRERAEESALASERSYRRAVREQPAADVDSRRRHAGDPRGQRRRGRAVRLLARRVPGADALRHRRAERDARGRCSGTSRATSARTAPTSRRERSQHSVTFNGRPALCVVAEDIGERERLESQLRQAQKMEADRSARGRRRARLQQPADGDLRLRRHRPEPDRRRARCARAARDRARGRTRRAAHPASCSRSRASRCWSRSCST